MRHLAVKTLAVPGLLLLLLLGSPAKTQQYPPRGSNQYQDRDHDRDWDRDGGRLIDRLRNDLDHARSNAVPFTGDWRRIATARSDVNRLERDMTSGRYDHREFDQALGDVQRVIEANRLPERDRDVLASDLHRLRELREQHDSFPRQ